MNRAIDGRGIGDVKNGRPHLFHAVWQPFRRSHVMPRIRRRFLFDPAEVGLYHCINRCVRRSFLCGTDQVSGRNDEHRKQWIQDRTQFLGFWTSRPWRMSGCHLFHDSESGPRDGLMASGELAFLPPKADRIRIAVRL